ncbi:hypothetical protein KXD40_002122 [Peronospora effusa]|uniref:SCP domain-containing protein n=1 Tax=Peronospora effusa TaxID=542832 RepID=A0A3M6V8E9_9STRA|nr:hypothetical protein DD238_005877 [Peronospora effusa]RQM12226.1 hypothetical protein DD237_006412 [Peronospora effusa]UIZ26344.1 hypothetical protein KXD40_002122 [Peronospora effusa]
MSPLFLLVLAVMSFGYSTAAEGTELTPVVNRHLRSASSKLDWRAEMLKKVNQVRADHGVGPLCMNIKLQNAAQVHSTDMAVHNLMSHTGTDGSQPQKRIHAEHYVESTQAENVASGQKSIDAVMASWMNSPKHRANILSPRFTMFGCGFDDKDKSKFPSYWTQVFAASKSEKCS